MENKQHRVDILYIRMARIWAENSYCQRRKVGALIVKDKMIISDGYNGTPSGFENVCEDENGVSKPYVMHAEANAITKVAVMVQPYILLLLLVLNVPSLSYKPVSKGLSMQKNIVYKMD